LEIGLSIIQPGLFLILQRFPNRKDALRRLYRKSKSFQGICHSYQECSKALDYWAKSDHEEAPHRQREYSELINELELEILQSLEDEQN
jgi:hypothetical protein